VWGAEERLVQWMCPYNTATKKITEICLVNVRTQKVINALQVLQLDKKTTATLFINGFIMYTSET
jgi:hypothetical protein